jgi:hypothetical protein
VRDRDAATDPRRTETLAVEKALENHLLVKPASPRDPDPDF